MYEALWCLDTPLEKDTGEVPLEVWYEYWVLGHQFPHWDDIPKQASTPEALPSKALAPPHVHRNALSQNQPHLAPAIERRNNTIVM
jgi:hypothetical protein